MSAISVYLENIIDECGGFSKFQWMLILTTFGSKLAPTWSMLMMTFAGAEPDWYCMYDLPNTTIEKQELNWTVLTVDSISSSSYQQCHPSSNATTQSCTSINFDNQMDTVVSEWTLVCGSDWIPSAITSIQMAGLLLSGFLAGHVADYIGRKPTYFLSLVLLIVFNICAGFSSSWQTFAVFRFLLGLGIGSYLTVFYNFLIEFVPANRRAIVMALPSWAFWAAIFGFVSMWLHNWKYLHFAIAICTAPWLLFWWITPESFRFLVTHGKLEEAEKVIVGIARMNGRPVPDLSRIKSLGEEETDLDTEKKYSIKHLFTSPYLLRITSLLSVGWLFCGYGFYAISFGVQSLSGSLYINMFLLSVVDAPGLTATYFLNNWIGRKKTALGLLTLAGIAGVVVAVLQITDLEMKDQLINGFAMTSKIGVAAGWAALMLLTTESYPTVVRNIGYGLQNSVSRVGAMIAPQVVYLNNHVPGIIYFVFGGVMFLSTLCTALVPETNKKPIEDVIDKKENKFRINLSRKSPIISQTDTIKNSDL